MRDHADLPIAPTTHVLYLHGFRSSPRSAKARTMQAWLAQNHPQVQWLCPQLPVSPAQAMALIEAAVHDWPRSTMAIMGSSLGGFYAACLATHLQCRAVVINPAVYPERDLAKVVGVHPVWHDPQQHIRFEPDFLQQLRELRQASLGSAQALIAPQAQQTLALIATGDEVLDWHEMQGFYQHCKVHIIQGSDHGLSEFDQHLPVVSRFLQL